MSNDDENSRFHQNLDSERKAMDSPVMEHFDNLPLDLSLHIFSLVPIESVSDCALVSKSWKNFIHSLSFYTMHKDRLFELIKEAKADYGQKMKEAVEYRNLARPTLEQAFESSDPIHFLRFHNEKLEEKINSMSLTDEKWANSIRLAKKTVKICKEYRELGKSPFEAGRRKQTAKTFDSRAAGAPAGDCSQFLPSPAIPTGAACFRKANKISGVPAACTGASGTPTGDCSQFLPSPAVPIGAACSCKTNKISSAPAACTVVKSPCKGGGRNQSTAKPLGLTEGAKKRWVKYF